MALAASGLSPMLMGRGGTARAAGSSGVFQHGVASGDPRQGRVIIWTRVTQPDPSATVTVDWEVSLRPDMAGTPLKSGSVSTSAQVDFTVKVDVTGLWPGVTYYYRFRALNETSSIGRTRTFPTGSPERLRLGVVSCSHYPKGYFNAYRQLALRSDLDAVLHLGDYIYEFSSAEVDGSAIGRASVPNAELIVKSQYRQRYAQYRSDPDLQEVHRQHPFISIWDDHEFAADAWSGGSKNHDESTEGPWWARKLAAAAAYLEWMPIRAGSWVNGAPIIYRTVDFGDLAQLTMLDTRMAGRDVLVETDDPAVTDASRHILGDSQQTWLFDRLSGASAANTQWKLLAQQVMLSQLTINPGKGLRSDHWDGYPAARDRLLRHIKDNSVQNVVVLTGDFHSSWATELSLNPYDSAVYDADTSKGALAVEFLTPGVTGEFPDDLRTAMQDKNVEALNPHVKFMDVYQRGYMLVDVDRTRVQAEWYHTIVHEPSPQQSFAGGFAVARGSNRLVFVGTPSPAGPNTSPPAPT